MRCAYEGPAPTPPSEVGIEIEVNRITSHLSLVSLGTVKRFPKNLY